MLAIKELSIVFEDRDGRIHPAIHSVSLDIPDGAITCLVGESGCGKSLTAKACLRLLPGEAKVSGSILFNGKNLLSLPEAGMQDVRGKSISMVFQEPMTALNPVFTVGSQVAEVLRLHEHMRAEKARSLVIELFRQVGIPSPEQRYDAFPHELSGGLRQRVVIAMALACEPKVLLADEPTTALDPTIQGQILRIISEQAHSRGMAVLFITHDLGVVAQIARMVGVMYAGHLVEFGTVQEIFSSPLHPYTRGLMAAAPSRDSLFAKRLQAIPGVVPKLGEIPAGCPFHPRCPLADDLCRTRVPEDSFQGTHRIRCWHISGRP